jgi:hypothetical protein
VERGRGRERCDNGKQRVMRDGREENEDGNSEGEMMSRLKSHQAGEGCCGWSQKEQIAPSLLPSLFHSPHTQTICRKHIAQLAAR